MKSKLTSCLWLGSFLLLNTSCERETFTGFEEETQIENYKLFIQSNPTNAAIYLDGKNTGKKTSDTLDWLSPGKNKITLKLELYEDTTEVVNIVKGRSSNLFIDFEANSRNYGKIDCSTIPIGAEIILAGKPTNLKTPTTIKGVLPGHHFVRFSYPYHRDDTLFVTVRSNETSRLHSILEDTTKWVSYNTNNSKIPSNTVFSIAVDIHNNVWVGTALGLSRTNGKEWFSYSSTILKTDLINHLTVDAQNRLWVSTAKGIYVLENSILIDYSFNLTSSSVRMITISKNGTVWAATNIGLCKLVNQNWVVYNTSNSGLKDNYVTSIAVDKDEKVWAGSGFHGISVFDGSSWSYYDRTNINLTGVVGGAHSIHIGKDGRVWVGMINPQGTGPVICFDGKIWTLISRAELTNNLTQSIYSSNERVFLGTKKGLGILEADGSFKFISNGNSRLEYLRIQILTLDNSGDLWTGTFLTGCGKLKKEHF